MGFDALEYYFQSGWQALTGEAALNWTGIVSLLNLTTLIDVVLVLVLLWWVWTKIRGTSLAPMLRKIAAVLLLMFAAKLFGFLAFFYATFAGLIVLLIALGVIYHQDFKKILDSGLSYGNLARKSTLSGDYNVKRFLSELSDTVVSLARSKISALIVVKTETPLGKLADSGTPLYTPFSKEFVWDVFSHRSKLSAGAMIVDNGVIVAGGSTLTVHAPKRFIFNLNNIAIRQAAMAYAALVIITYKDKEEISVLHKNSAYAKLSPKNLDRVLKTILLG